MQGSTDGRDRQRRAIASLCLAVEKLVAGACAIACALALTVMAVGIVAEIVARNVFDYSFLSVDEVSGYLLVAVIFLGLAVAVHDNALFRVEILTERLSASKARMLDWLLSLVFIGFVLVLDYQCFQLAMDSLNGSYSAPTLLGTPLYIPQLLMPIGLSATALILVLRVVRLSIARSDPQPEVGR